jgi:aminoglycoside phosphotransferase family enzyme/predicted kinase
MMRALPNDRGKFMSHILIQNLQNASLYNHAIEEFKLLETHISWVILTGEYVYKIKKPFDFEFLNFSTLEKRKFYCHEEVRLNQFLAPEIYLDVVSITGSIENPSINGDGPVIEYAIRMREFSQASLFSALLNNHQLTTNHLDQLAQTIAWFHSITPAAEMDSRFGTAEHVHAPVVQNFDQIQPLLSEQDDLKKLALLREWSEKQYLLYKTLLQQRKSEDFIRDCHGDLHLGNIILHEQKPVLFDRIEFNEDFRWTDVMADIAFLAMDLSDKKQTISANQVINAYLSHTGDYEGLAVLPYYQVYRAMVRAKVALFGLQPDTEVHVRNQVMQQYRNLIALAEKYIQPATPKLLITHGFAGAGKSTVASELAAQLGGIQIRADLERKRLFDVAATAQNETAVLGGIYTPEATEQVYQQLLMLAETVIQAGYVAIIDATFLKQHQRELFYKLAQKLQISFAILSCQASQEKLIERIETRRFNMQDPSEARVDILQMQKTTAEALTEQEKKFVLEINTEEMNIAKILKELSEFK